MKKKVFVARAIFPETIARLSEYFEVDANSDDRNLTREEFCDRLGRAHGVFLAGERVDAEAIAGAPLLKAVSNMSVGYNNLDLPALRERGIVATNTPDVLNETVADFGWALMMCAARRVAEADRWTRKGAWSGWSYDMFLGGDVHGSTLGIIGMGRIGRAIARRAVGFNMNVLYYNRSRCPVEVEREVNARYVAKDELLKNADHVLLVLPYSPDTHHTIAERELQLMKPTATITNIGRGGIVDDDALLDALIDKRIGAAALDVFENEPRFNPGFLTLDNVVLTPHMAPASEFTRRRMADLAAENLIAALGEGVNAGHPPNIIDV
ncbi:2-hydroxyacid dehydrogenase [Paraburkholderia sp. HD33-4]|uniref:2-hydroxyacid dehydrogenase n=1 Tax=Paraburkholderia sp. HD33-4 TaxID=2883242 RepID=UPI001F1CA2C8|nr:D-glycerate dehydrogenase [Paraburkholderia sp. HD33-4]